MTRPERPLRARVAGAARPLPAGRPVAPAPPAGGHYVALDALRTALETAEWAPLRLASTRRDRPASPRLPHALLLHLARQARELAGAGAPGALATTPVLPELAHLEGLLGADRTLVAGALDALRRAGVLAAPADPDAAAGGAVCLAAAALGPDPRCAALDWRALAAATAGSPSAWVAAHVLAERLDPYHWTPVPRGALEHALGCGVSGVRGALDRLASADVVERREQRGGVSVYRFTDRAWGRGAEPALPAPAPVRPASAAARPARAPEAGLAALAAARPAPPPAPDPDPGVRLVLGGVELELPAGCRVQVAIGPDGRPTVTLAAPGNG